jgi:hypothetical protein
VKRFVLLALLLPACGSANEGDPSPAPTPEPRYALCADAVVPNGFGLAWEKLNHRISRWSIRVDPSKAETCSANPGSTLHTTFVGGDWTTGQAATDVPIVMLDYAVVAPRDPNGAVRKPQHVWATHHATALDIDPSQHASAIADRPASEHPRVEVLTGLELDTNVPQDADYPEDYDPAHGYTSRGVTARVTDRDDGSVDVEIAFEHGKADRPPMNAAMPFARTRAVVEHTTLEVPGGHITRATKQFRLTYPLQDALDATPIPHGEDALMTTVIEGVSGYEHGMVLLTGISFSLFPDLPYGDYLRELSVRPRNVRYDPETGRAKFVLDGYASNSGFLTMAGMDADMRFDLVLVQWNGGGAPVQVSFSSSFDTGEASFALPME